MWCVQQDFKYTGNVEFDHLLYVKNYLKSLCTRKKKEGRAKYISVERELKITYDMFKLLHEIDMKLSQFALNIISNLLCSVRSCVLSLHTSVLEFILQIVQYHFCIAFK